MSSLFRPPIVRTGTAALNRALFTRKIPLAAAAVHDARLIAAYRKRLHASKELLDLDRVSPIAKHPDPVLAEQGKKCFLLEPNARPEKPETWGPVVREGVQKEELGVVDYELVLGYEYWSYREYSGNLGARGRSWLTKSQGILCSRFCRKNCMGIFRLGLTSLGMLVSLFLNSP